MTSPFAWMVGQIEAAVAHQEPLGAVAMTPGKRTVIRAIRELGPITSGQLAQFARVHKTQACRWLYKADRAGVVRVVGKRSWQGREMNLYDLAKGTRNV